MYHVDVYSWISDSPPVLRYAISNSPWAQYLPDCPVYRLPFPHWAYTADDLTDDFLSESSKRPRDEFCYLVNDRNTLDGLIRQRTPAELVNHNAFLDERIFTIDDTIPKLFDAVYVAQMDAFKRHSLARSVQRMLFIDGRVGRGELTYCHAVQQENPTATFTHADHPDGLKPTEVAKHLNQCRVGLCLSAKEGAMYACCEYLLCGLPIVSTVSVGGRDEWFDNDFVRIVNDDPAAVKQAVDDLVKEAIPGHYIRQRTLDRIMQHRRRFVDLVQAIYDSESTGRIFLHEWDKKFYNKWADWKHISSLTAHCQEQTDSCNVLDDSGILEAMAFPAFEYRVNFIHRLSSEEQRTLSKKIEALPHYFRKYVCDGICWFEFRYAGNIDVMQAPDISITIDSDSLYISRENGSIWMDLDDLLALIKANISGVTRLWV